MENETLSGDDIINEMLSEETPAGDQELAQTPEEVEAVEALQAEAAPAEEVTEPQAEPKSQLSPLLAERARAEKELRTQLETQKSEMEKAVSEARAQVLAELTRNPQEFISKHSDLDLDHLATHFYAASLPEDEVPEDLKAHIGQSDLAKYKAEVEKRFTEMEQRRAAEQEAAKAQTIIEQYKGFMEDVPSDMPYFAAEVANSSEDAFKAIAELADHIYEAEGRYPTATRVAGLFESNIREVLARYSGIGTVKEKAPVRAVTEQNPTLTNDTDLSGGKPLPTTDEELLAYALSFED